MANIDLNYARKRKKVKASNALFVKQSCIEMHKVETYSTVIVEYIRYNSPRYKLPDLAAPMAESLTLVLFQHLLRH